MKASINEMTPIWEEYRTRLTGDDYLIKDGISPERAEDYFAQNKKILFILKESYEDSKNNVVSRTEKSIFDAHGWFGSYSASRSNKKMITKMIKIYKYITEDYPTEKNIAEYKIESKDIYKFAFININKRGNGGRICNDKFLRRIISQDHDLLLRQIDYLSPDVIVFGCKNFYEIFNKLVFNNLQKKPEKIAVTKHFSRLGYNEFKEEI